jgi:hypothetical protein
MGAFKEGDKIRLEHDGNMANDKLTFTHVPNEGIQPEEHVAPTTKTTIADS